MKENTSNYNQAQLALSCMDSCESKFDSFQALIKSYYTSFGRSFSWREHISPYRILVSEVMLQQTQTLRAESKFEAFCERFPDFFSLATAPVHEVLKLWSGLGYNRRALSLQRSAQIVLEKYDGLLPRDPELLITLPGIGKATAGSIACFAYNEPTVFIETNIRTVFIFFFFTNRLDVSDSEIEALVHRSLDTKNPRAWYYALMDYGVMLKKTVGNLSKQSAHYHKQSKFEGSHRQLRGQILRAILANPTASKEELYASLAKDPLHIDRAFLELQNEGFIAN